MNKAHEPLLYACVGLPIDTLTEARIIEPDTPFILIGYEVVEPLILRRVGEVHDPSLTARQRRIETKLSEFLAEVVSIPAEHLEARTYEHTQTVLQHYYTLEPNWESGWVYRSTLIHPSNPDVPPPLNVALEAAEAHSKLRVRSVVIGTQNGADGGAYLLGLHAHSDGVANEDGLLTFSAFPHEQLDGVDAYMDFLISTHFEPHRAQSEI